MTVALGGAPGGGPPPFPPPLPLFPPPFPGPGCDPFPWSPFLFPVLSLIFIKITLTPVSLV